MWGKTTPSGMYPLEAHLLDTSGAALALWDTWLRPGLRDLLTRSLAPGDPESARNVFAAVAGLHDIGKANPVFQSQSLAQDVPDIVREYVERSALDMTIPDGAEADVASIRRHEAVSLAVLSGYPADTAEKVGKNWAGAIISGHHGRYHPGTLGECAHTRDAMSALLADPAWETERARIIETVLTACGVTRSDISRPLRHKETVSAILLTGLVILADWLASSAVGAVRTPLSRPTAYVQQARQFFVRSIPATLGVHRPPAHTQRQVMGGRDLYPLQRDALDVGRGLWVVAETTGSGKTEAAMLRHFTSPEESVIWGLPTRATADKMWGRIQKMYARTRNVGALLHAHRSLDGYYLAKRQDGPGLRYSPWATEVLGNIKPLLSPVAVGTVDQVLLASLRQKWNPVRLLAVANAHVILDEVHLMDEYQVQLTEELLRWWGQTDTRVTMLSASLPHALTTRFARAYAQKELDIPRVYPSHTRVHRGRAHVQALQSARTYELDIDLRTFRGRSGETPAQTLVRHAVNAVCKAHREHPTARIAVIVNRVQHAQLIAAELMSRGLPDVTTMHSRMAAGHRTRLNGDLEAVAGKESRVEGSVVVGTQVIEASLDLDFDVLFTELAPAPALIQRAGRQWRSSRAQGTWSKHWHDRPTERPRMSVLALLDAEGHPSEALALPYAYGALCRTYDALQGRTSLSIPGDVQDFVDTAFYNIDDDEHGTSDEITAAHNRALAAQDVCIDVRGTQALSYATLVRLTQPDPQTEAATRYSDYEQVPVLIVDEFSRGRWALRATSLDPLRTRAPREVGVLLAHTFPVPMNMLGSGLVPLIDVAKRFEDSPFAATELRGVVPVALAGSVHYDEHLGLVN